MRDRELLDEGQLSYRYASRPASCWLVAYMAAFSVNVPIRFRLLEPEQPHQQANASGRRRTPRTTTKRRRTGGARAPPLHRVG